VTNPFAETAGEPLPLEGITVLDLGQIYQGPYAGFLLSQAGARVIKVEPPAGETLRTGGPNLALAMLNSGKEAVAIDLKQAAGVELFLRLVERVDVVLVNMAVGVPERLGIGFEDLRAVNPRIVFAHAAGFGVRQLDGSLNTSSIPAMDITVQAHSGAMSVTGDEDQPPLRSGAAYIDFLGGTHLFGAITSALLQVARTGKGRSVEVSMADTAHFALTTGLREWQRTGSTKRTGNRHAGLGIAPYNVYRCADGHVAIITVAERHWPAVLSVIGREDLDGDDRFRSRGRRAHNIDAVDQLVENWTSQRPRDEVVAALQDAHVPAAAVRTIDEAVRDQAQHERQGLQWVEHPDLGQAPLATSPIRFHGSGVASLQANPAVGEHNEQVFAELGGLSSDEIAALAAAGVTEKGPA